VAAQILHIETKIVYKKESAVVTLFIYLNK
jgi:hypothetical protein